LENLRLSRISEEKLNNSVDGISISKGIDELNEKSVIKGAS